jgi:hypothetical protein
MVLVLVVLTTLSLNVLDPEEWTDDYVETEEQVFAEQ